MSSNRETWRLPSEITQLILCPNEWKQDLEDPLECLVGTLKGDIVALRHEEQDAGCDILACLAAEILALGLMYRCRGKDSPWVAVSAREKGICAVNADDGQVVSFPQLHQSPPHTLASSASRPNILVSASPGELIIWDTDVLQPLRALRGPSLSLRNALVSPDRIRGGLVGVFDEGVWQWSLQSIGKTTASDHKLKLDWRLKLNLDATAKTAFSEDGMYLLVLEGEHVSVWDVVDREVMRTEHLGTVFEKAGFVSVSEESFTLIGSTAQGEVHVVVLGLEGVSLHPLALSPVLRFAYSLTAQNVVVQHKASPRQIHCFSLLALLSTSTRSPTVPGSSNTAMTTQNQTEEQFPDLASPSRVSADVNQPLEVSLEGVDALDNFDFVKTIRQYLNQGKVLPPEQRPSIYLRLLHCDPLQTSAQYYTLLSASSPDELLKAFRLEWQLEDGRVQLRLETILCLLHAAEKYPTTVLIHQIAPIVYSFITALGPSASDPTLFAICSAIVTTYAAPLCDDPRGRKWGDFVREVKARVRRVEGMSWCEDEGARWIQSVTNGFFWGFVGKDEFLALTDHLLASNVATLALLTAGVLVSVKDEVAAVMEDISGYFGRRQNINIDEVLAAATSLR